MIKIKFLDKLLSLIYIRQCFYCLGVKEDARLCSSCRKKIRFRTPDVYREYAGCRIYACTVYESVIKELIHFFKYKGRKNLAPVFAQIMFEYFEKLQLKEDFVVLSVPIHKKRRKERGYNHMDTAADEFSALSGLKNNKKFLIRIKDTEKQFKLTNRERAENIKGAFALNEKEKIDKTAPLLIIDDITASGITLYEIIKLLKDNGYNNITALALSAPELGCRLHQKQHKEQSGQ